jgi:hypothetical protein
MDIKKISLSLLGFLQATVLLFYISLVSVFMLNASTVIGPANNIIGPIAFLLLFVISAIISGLIVLGKAGLLFWEKKQREAITLVGWTVGWLILYLALILTILYLFRILS